MAFVGIIRKHKHTDFIEALRSAGANYEPPNLDEFKKLASGIIDDEQLEQVREEELIGRITLNDATGKLDHYEMHSIGSGVFVINYAPTADGSEPGTLTRMKELINEYN